MTSAGQNAGSQSSESKQFLFWRRLFSPFSRKTHKIFDFLSRRGWGTRLAFLLTLAAIISGITTYAALTETPPFGNDPNTVIWLLNLDLVILLLLMTLIARRMARIWSGRRQGLAGSRLHVRLVMIFSVMAAVPAILMAIFSAFFFHFGVQSWFSERVETAVFESQAVAEAYLEEHQQVIKADLLAMANDLDRQSHLIDDPMTFERVMDTQSGLRNLSEALVFDSSGNIIARSQLTFTLAFERVPDTILEQTEDGEVVILADTENDRVRALVKLQNFVDSYLFVGRTVDADVLSHVQATRDATAQYIQLQGRYSGLQITVTMIFVVVSLLLLLAAIWFGIVLARQLVTPISRLISVSDRVSSGDLTARVSERQDIEEFDFLARSFNRMTSQIQEQRDELIAANRQLDQRRRFTETILTGVSAGIVGVDERGAIKLANSSAGKLFQENEDALIGTNISDIVPEIKELLQEAYKKSGKITQSEIPFQSKDGGKLTLLVRIAVELIGDDEKGAVLTFDDITELQSAQRKAAWADVARRIAHEIKNPLTPIQLSAERLKRKYLKEIQTDPQIFSQCTDTIIRHVGDIGRMVNEFSAFARMPEPVIKSENLGRLIQEIVVLQREAHPEISFTFKGIEAQDAPIMVACDAQQVRQAIVNLTQNAIDSIQSRLKQEKDKVVENDSGKILFFISEQPIDQNCLVTVADNGLGFPDNEDIATLTEPYVTHKEKGTGLGLAIVKKIMEDHQGRLVLGLPKWLKKEVGDMAPYGAMVTMVIPLAETLKQSTKKQAA